MSVNDFHTLSFLPNDKSYWLVANWGKIFSTGEGSFRVDVILSRVIDIKSYKPDEAINCNEYVVVNAPLAALRDLQIGSLWHQQRLFKPLSSYRKVTNPLFFLDPSAAKKGLYRDIGVNHQLNLPDYLLDMPIRYFKKGEDFDYGWSDIIIFPCAAIAKYYFFKSAHLIHHVLSGNLEAETNKAFNPSRCLLRKNPDNKREALVWLRRETEDTDDYKIARMAFDNYYLASARGVYASRLENDSLFIESNFPIKGKTRISVRGRYVEARMNDRPVNCLFVYSIHKCSSQPPFDLLYRGSDRDNRPAEITEQTKYIDKKFLTSISPVSVDTPAVGSGTSNKNTEPTVIGIEDDEEANFDLRKIKPLRKSFQKYAGAFAIIEKLDQNPDYTASHEKDSTSTKFQTKFDEAGSSERFNDGFNLFDSTIDLLQRSFGSRLVVKSVVPFPYDHRDYEGFSVFPFLKLRDLKSIYNWCHLTKVHKGYWVNPRRVKILELCLDGVRNHYLIEIEQRTLEECTLLYVAKKSLDVIQEEYLKDLLFECAKNKGVWSKVRSRFDNVFNFVPMRHTKLDHLVSRIKLHIS